MVVARSLVLLIDDEADAAALHQAALERGGHDVRVCTSPLEALRQLDGVSVVITDLVMDELDGLTLCEQLRNERPELPVIVLTGAGAVDAAVGAIRAGAYDFLTKPVDPLLLLAVTQRALERVSLKREVTTLREAAATTPLHGILGHSQATQRMLDLINRLAPTSASVLVVGETGTGKELVARALHQASPRKNGPFVAINCAAVAPTLLESELFGHAKGAYTDAKTSRTGLFSKANEGTLFLDEIGEMSAEMQAKLLRALQERKVRPVGSDTEVAFDVRIVSATHRDLDAAVEAGTFRQDLFYRINVVTIEVPALRERGHDVLELAEHALRASSQRNARAVPPRMSSSVAAALLAYPWPGNIRELENCIERATSLARFDELMLDDLPPQIGNHQRESFKVSADEPSEIITVAELQQRYTARVLKLLNGNKSRAAKLLGLDRRTLYRRLEIDGPDDATALPAQAESNGG